MTVNDAKLLHAFAESLKQYPGPVSFRPTVDSCSAIANSSSMDKSNYFPDDQQVEEKAWHHRINMFTNFS